MAKNILIIDDDQTLCSMISGLLDTSGYTTQYVHCLDDGYDKAVNGNFDIILLDVQLPDGDGLEDMPRFAAVSSHPEIIIMTGDADSDGARKAIESGAWDYLEKVNIIREIMLPVTRALQYREEKNKIATTPVILQRKHIIGDSDAITKSLEQVAFASGSDAAVLITGETGTGKEVFAHAIHDNSKRRDHNFIVVDCAALPSTLIESTLFGHAKGAFTGAEKESKGLIVHADGGTLFLDEIGELPLDIQKKFLRVLQEQRYRPVGSTMEISSNFRVIAATNRNLETMVDKGEFREDLLFRLRSFFIELPPLRERKGDVPQLTKYILEKLWKRQHLAPQAISGECLDYLELYDWPGNVRELQQTLEEVVARSQGHQTLFAFHLPGRIRIKAAQSSLNAEHIPASGSKKLFATRPQKWKQYKEDMESQYIKQLMAYCEGDVKSACEVSGISRARLYELLRKETAGPEKQTV
ncbi:sigma-54-dependent transcriptional regulator [Desulfogranum japonicum]|uniref:sigma-54-dependent transcriptional regulator n=1 Tax=Desulfogranum japonicum TaxID=231447 RepID=UPI00040D5341|nr:sigma-54 dependent transcriptional regulator [Desulfogranum japonicum]